MFDGAAIIEAKDEKAAMKFASEGNVRLETLRAYSADEMDEVLQKTA